MSGRHASVDPAELKVSAAGFPGSSCAEKVNAANQSTAGHRVTIVADDGCGTSFPISVRIAAQHKLVLAQTAPVIVGQPVLLAGVDSSLECIPSVSLREAPNVALTGLISNVPGISGVTIAGCAIDGNGRAQSHAPFEGANGIFLFDLAHAQVTRVRVENTRTNGIRVQKGAEVSVTDSVFDRIGSAGVNASAIDFTANVPARDSSGITIARNRVGQVTGTGNGIFISGFPPGRGKTRRVVISDNLIGDSADECIEVNNVEDFTIERNTCRNGRLKTSAGIYLRSSSRGAVHYNVLRQQVVGIQIDPTADADANDIEVLGNVVADCKAESGNSGGIRLTTAGARGSVAGWKLMDNHITGCPIAIEVAGLLSGVSGEIARNRLASTMADVKLSGTIGPVILQGNAFSGRSAGVQTIGIPRVTLLGNAPVR